MVHPTSELRASTSALLLLPACAVVRDPRARVSATLSWYPVTNALSWYLVTNTYILIYLSSLSLRSLHGFFNFH